MKLFSQLHLTRTVATVLCVAALSMPAHAVTSGGGASGGGDKGRGAGASHSGSDRNDIAKVTKAKAATTQLAPNVSVDAHLAPSGSFNVTAPNRGFNVTTVPGGSFNVTAAPRPRAPRTAPVVNVQAPSLTADSCAKPAHLNNELTCELTTHRE